MWCKSRKPTGFCAETSVVYLPQLWRSVGTLIVSPHKYRSIRGPCAWSGVKGLVFETQLNNKAFLSLIRKAFRRYLNDSQY